MVCDKPISDQIPEPLPRTAHYMISCGPPRSGKTSALISMLTQKRPQLYRRAFHNIMVIMPPSSRRSLKNDPFDSIDEDKVYDDLSPAVLEDVHKRAEAEMKKNRYSLLFVDDMASQLKNHDCLKAWNKLINNRRHLRLSVWCIVQTYTSIPLSNRRTVTHAMVFKPNNKREGDAITEELIMMPSAEWEAYVNHAFGAGTPHAFLFLDVENQAVYDAQFGRLNYIGGGSHNQLAYKDDHNLEASDQKEPTKKHDARNAPPRK